MRYHQRPRSFRTSHWADLWRSNVTDLVSIQNLCATSGFVMVDAEGWGDRNDQISEIAVSLVGPVAVSERDRHPKSLEELHEAATVYTHHVSVKGREHGKSRREPFWADAPGENGQVHLVDAADVESTLTGILDGFQSLLRDSSNSHSDDTSHAMSATSIILVGFDIAFELRVLAMHYPTVMRQYFSHWIDLQETIYDLSTKARDNEKPGMRGCLLALGFQEDTREVVSPETKHNAGNDVMLMAAILINLFSFSHDAKLDIPQRSHRKRQQKRTVMLYKTQPFFKSSRPYPVARYPFAAKVILTTSNRKGLSGIQLSKAFSQFHPTAVGTIPKWRAEIGGWICLPSLEELNSFVKSVNGATSELCSGTWEVTSVYDPEQTPVRTSEEVALYLAAQSTIEAEKKKDKRRGRDKENDRVAMLGDFDFAASDFANLTAAKCDD